MPTRKRRSRKVYDSSKDFHGNHIKDSSTTMTCTNSNITKMQSRCTDAFNRNSYNNNHNININFINCNDPEQIMNAILPSLPSLNSRSRKRALSEIANNINGFHSNKRLKVTRSGGVGAGIRKYMPKNYSHSSNNKNKNYNYFGNESGCQNNYSNHNNNNCNRLSNSFNILKNGSPTNCNESNGGWIINSNSKTKTQSIHPYYDKSIVSPPKRRYSLLNRPINNYPNNIILSESSSDEPLELSPIPLRRSARLRNKNKKQKRKKIASPKTKTTKKAKTKQNNNNNHNNNNCNGSSNLFNVLNNGFITNYKNNISPPLCANNFMDGDDRFIDINSKTKTHPIHYDNTCTNESIVSPLVSPRASKRRYSLLNRPINKKPPSHTLPCNESSSDEPLELSPTPLRRSARIRNKNRNKKRNNDNCAVFDNDNYAKTKTQQKRKPKPKPKTKPKTKTKTKTKTTKKATTKFDTSKQKTISPMDQIKILEEIYDYSADELKKYRNLIHNSKYIAGSKSYGVKLAVNDDPKRWFPGYECIHVHSHGDHRFECKICGLRAAKLVDLRQDAVPHLYGYLGLSSRGKILKNMNHSRFYKKFIYNDNRKVCGYECVFASCTSATIFRTSQAYHNHFRVHK